MRCVLLNLLLSACSGVGDSLSADEELLLSATGGAEEGLVSRAAYGALGAESDPDQPPLLRECDADGTYHDIFASYDADGDGALDHPEQEDVSDARADRGDIERREIEMRWRMMLLIYDLDEDGALSDSERATLFDDFTVRCEVLSDKLLAEFDADGDGTLSADELATATATLEAERAAHYAEMGPPEGHDGPPPEPGSRAVPPGLEHYDTDGDALLSDAELSALRDALRALIRAGEPPVEPPAG